MKLRGLIHRKLKARKKMTDEELKYYNRIKGQQLGKLEKQRMEARKVKIKEKAMRDARYSSTTGAERAGRLLVTAGRSVGSGLKKRIEAMPDADEYARRMEKTYSAVTGVPTGKKKM